MTTALIKIVFYLPGNYTPHSLEYTIPQATACSMEGEHDRFWRYPGQEWLPLSQTPTFKRLFSPVLHKLHAQNVTAYIKKTS